MKHLTMWVPVLVVMALGCDLAPAQTPAAACQADIFVSNIRARGRLVRVGNSLVFLDDRNFGAPLSIDRSNIQSADQEGGVLSVYTRRQLRYGGLTERHFAFQLFSGNCYPMATWFCGRATPIRRYREGNYYPYREANYYRSTPSRRVYWAKQKRTWRSDIGGRLIISYRSIEFEDADDGGHTKRWALKDLKDIELEGRRVLKVTPLGSDSYTFELRDRGISPAEFRSIRNRIYRANYAH